MLYLEQRRFIHRDLAARNILVNDVCEARTVKIGDFGLARDFDFKPGTDVSGNDDAAASDCSFIVLGHVCALLREFKSKETRRIYSTINDMFCVFATCTRHEVSDQMDSS